MNAYFFNVTKEERENILDKHKTLYDGYVTMQNKPNNMERLTVQDLANDKNGITLNNKGEVTAYKNFGINESTEEIDEEVCPNCGLSESTCECEEEIIDESDIIDEIEDEDLKEGFRTERAAILDVFNRFKNFN